jgi:4-amino-4-deoxy-L-arabinose transferase-like glycosyltransferase
MNWKRILLYLSIFSIYVLGFFIDIMDVDSAQYASMSREMLETGNFLSVYDTGIPYLDKPPFLFWISSLSIHLFGVNGFGYRFPSFLFGLLAIYSTYKLARRYYSEETSFLAALMLATCQGFFLMMHDVRTDTMLMGAVVFSIWQLDEWLESRKFLPFFWGFTGIAIGMMTKGPIGLLVPCFALGAQVFAKREFNLLLRWEYIFGILLVAVFLFPMSWGLYQQFDMHPETVVNGKSGASGLRFFYWTQSFGRITGESPWDNGATIFFLLQNMLWSFLPWILFFIPGWFSAMVRFIKDGGKLATEREVISLGGFTLSYLALGLSKYQLPHYIFVAFPLAAIIAAKYLSRLIEEKKTKLLSRFFTSHAIILSLIWVALGILLFFPFPDLSLFWPILAIAGLVVFVLLARKNKNNIRGIIIICLFTIVGVNLLLNSVFYPRLLKYQAGSSCGKWLHNNGIPAEKTFTYGFSVMRSLHYYAHGIVKQKDNAAAFSPGQYAITLPDSIGSFVAKGMNPEIVFEGAHYPVTLLGIPFLNPKTRNSVVKPYVILKIK